MSTTQPAGKSISRSSSAGSGARTSSAQRCRPRMRASGGSGGHNGLNSINGALGTQDYARLRIGIGRPQGETVGYVLGAFTREEAPEAEAAIERAADAVQAWLTHGVNYVMDNFN